ncbi:unnamed protein product, partial [Iphiclides podalirius]
MACPNCLLVVLVLTLVTNINCSRLITIFSDFTNEDDLRFFRNIFPWIVGNVGSEIRVDYQFKDSGMASGPRKCILLQMDGNTYLQASYLKHEAEGKPRENFLYNYPVDSRKFTNCLFRNVNYYLKESQRKFSRLRSTETPTVLLSRDNEVSGMEPDILLDSLCQLFGRREPQGCIDPTPFNGVILQNELRPDIYNKKPRLPPYRKLTTVVAQRLPKKNKEPNTNQRDKYFYTS